MAITKRAKYTSKGERHSTSLKTLRYMRQDRKFIDVLLNKQNAWIRGQNPWLSVENSNPNETNKKFVRVRANSYWGHPNPKKEKEKMLP